MTDTILHHLIQRKDSCGKETAIQFKEGRKWIKYNWQEYFHLVESMGMALAALGAARGERIAIVSETRPEWVLTDLAIMGIGGVTVPIYPNNLDEDVEFIINDAHVKILILEDKEQLDKWRRISERCPSVENVILLSSPEESQKGIHTWMECLNKGRVVLRDNPQIFIESAKLSQIPDTATILYTSGTTGRPKGVVLTHEQIMSELIDVFAVILVTPDDLCLSFLPYSHVLGRVEAWGNIYAGYVMAFAESIEKIKGNMLEVRPTFLIAVPRIFEKIYAGILAQVENQKAKRKIFERALAIGKRVSETIQAKKSLGITLSLEYEMAKLLVFNKILAALGGRLRFAVSGGAPLGPDISKFFHGIGLLICEGYGLTETTAGITFNTPLAYKFGTVGLPVGDVKLKIAEDGEILVHSKKVMKEYYHLKEATEESIQQGYFKTGDIGHVDEDGFLHITDRKKDLIKTAGGKYVAPQKLENLLKLNPYISNVLIHGDQKKYIIALITLNAPIVERMAKEKNLTVSSYEELTQDPAIYAIIRDAVAEANTGLASYESIKKFSILRTDFTVENGELTPSLKVKRRFCDLKYKKDIDELFSP